MANFGIQDFGKNKNEHKKPYCVGKRRQRNSINKKLRTESIKIIYFKTKKNIYQKIFNFNKERFYVPQKYYNKKLGTGTYLPFCSFLVYGKKKKR